MRRFVTFHWSAPQDVPINRGMEISRRAFLRSAGALGLLTAGGCAVGVTSRSASTPTPIGPPTTIGSSSPSSTNPFSTSQTAIPTAPSGVRVLAPHATIPNLDPIKWAEPDIQRLYRPCVESLYGWQSDGASTPILAAEPWEMSRDRLVYTVRLLDDVVFHDGTPLTAESVVDSFRAAMDPANASQWSRRLAMALGSVQAAGAGTVTFRLAHPFSPFETLLGLIPIVPSSMPYRPQETFAQTLVGTGPFRLDSWDGDGVLRYLSFDGHHLAAPGLAEFEVRFGDRREAAAALQTGEADLAVGLGSGDSSSISILTAPRSTIRYRALANLDPSRITSSPEVRRAISLALDRERLVGEVLYGRGAPARSAVWPSTDHALDDDTMLRTLRDTAAGDEELPTAAEPLRVVAVDDPTVRAMAGGVQDALGSLGLPSRLEVMSGTRLADILRIGDPTRFGEFDLLVVGSFAQPLTGFAPDYAFFELRSGLATNLTRVADPELDRLLDEAVAADPDDRSRLWGEVQRYESVASLTAIPIAEGRYGEAVASSLAGYQPSPTGTLDGLATISRL